MATIKAGTYRFNDALIIDTAIPSQDIYFEVNDTLVISEEQAAEYNGILGEYGDVIATTYSTTVTCSFMGPTYDDITLGYKKTEAVTSPISFGLSLLLSTNSGENGEITTAYNNAWACNAYQTITILSDSGVSDEFAKWFEKNSKRVEDDTPTATIIYNGSTIASLVGGQTATLKCKGDNMKMLSDIVVRVAGNSGVGGSVECNRQHVIEVDKLPTQNIDENAVYYCDGKYYKWANEFVDLFIREGGEVLSFAQVIGVDPSMLTYHIAPTKPKGNIEVSSESGFHFYYIEDENNVFFYGDFEETGNNAWFGIEVIFRGIQFNGVIANAGEITDKGAYALVEKGFRTYTYVSGTLKITQIGTYDVTDKASVVVNTPNEAIVGVWKFNVSEDGYIPLNTNGEGRYYSDSYDVNFTCVYNGEVKSCNKIEVGGDNTGGGEFISFYDIDGNKISAANGIEGSVTWNNEVSTNIDFGAEPQVIYKKLKDELVTVATPTVEVESGGEGDPLDLFIEGGRAEVNLPNATKIRDYGFYYDKTITNIVMPKVTSIGKSSFGYCSNLAQSSLPSGLTSIGANAFRDCSQLALTELPSGITQIDEDTFSNCSKLALTELPNGLKRIGTYAFCNCSNLALTELPSGITSIGQNAFMNCTKLAVSTLPSGVTYLNDSVFRGCTSIVSMEIPIGVTNVVGVPFRDCTGLVTVTFRGKPSFNSPSPFSGCTNLTTINVPWAEGAVSGAPWGATNATINYNYTGG